MKTERILELPGNVICTVSLHERERLVVIFERQREQRGRRIVMVWTAPKLSAEARQTWLLCAAQGILDAVADGCLDGERDDPIAPQARGTALYQEIYESIEFL